MSSLIPTYQRLPVAFSRGEGVWLYAEDGRRYLDAVGGIAVCALGHAHPAVTAAITQQAATLMHTSNLYEIPVQERLAGRLCELSGLGAVFFCNSGAEANEAALKLCRRWAVHQGRHEAKIVTMAGAFHGRTFATMTAGGSNKVCAGFGPMLPGFLQVPYADINALAALADSGVSVAAVMLEPIQGENGVVIPPRGTLKQIRQLCDDNGWLLVVDEVQTGLCRTGRWFATQHDGVRADIMTLAKSLANGLPIGACIARHDLGALLGAGSHGSTFGGNPLASHTALAVLEQMHTGALADRARDMGRYLLSGLRSLLTGCSGVTDIRGRGLMLGIELTADAPALITAALDRGLLINVAGGNVVRLLPPLIIERHETDMIIDILGDIILKAH